MKERPILFNGPMVRAILEGRKTQTRRVVKLPEFRQTDTPGYDFCFRLRSCWHDFKLADLVEQKCPYGQPGDRLWVRETWCKPDDVMQGYLYRATSPKLRDYVSEQEYPGGWKPSIHMPRLASRIMLEIVSVRVERLQDISSYDAQKEGLKNLSKDGGVTWKFGIPDIDGAPGNDDFGWHWHEWDVSPINAFSKLWKYAYGTQSWEANPWVWVIEFKRVGC